MNFLISQLIAIVQHVRQVTIYVHHIDNDNDRTKSFKTTDNETYVSILIQSCITVTRCTHTLLYHLYIILEREEQKKKRTNRDYIFSINPKTWWPINVVHPGLFKRNFVCPLYPSLRGWLFSEILFFFFYSKALLGYHQTPSDPYIRAVHLLLISATLSDVCSWGVSLYCKLL